MKSKLKIVDYNSIKSFHEVINTALAIICVNIFDDVCYKAGKSSCLHIKDLFKKQTSQCNGIIKFHIRPIYEASTSLGAFVRTIWGMFVTSKEYLFTQKNTVLLFNYTNPLSMPFILIFNYLLKKKVIFVMHGELELQLQQQISILKPAFWYRLCHKACLKHLFTGNKAIILVLGDSIKNNLCKIFPTLTPNVYSICHPYFIKDYQIRKKKKILTIGAVGVMKKGKGLDSFIKLSKELNELIIDNKLIIKSIGKVEDIDITNFKNIHWIGSKGLMPRKEFEEAIQTLDYILYLYPPDSYKLTASGAIMDAIKLGKPIIAFHNDYFDYLLQNVCIGFLVNNISEMIDIINKLVVSQHIDDYSKGFKLVSQKISIEENTSLFKQILKERLYIN